MPDFASLITYEELECMFDDVFTDINSLKPALYHKVIQTLCLTQQRHPEKAEKLGEFLQHLQQVSVENRELIVNHDPATKSR